MMKTLVLLIVFAMTALNMMNTSVRTIEIAAARASGPVMLADAR